MTNSFLSLSSTDPYPWLWSFSHLHIQTTPASISFPINDAASLARLISVTLMCVIDQDIASRHNQWMTAPTVRVVHPSHRITPHSVAVRVVHHHASTLHGHTRHGSPAPPPDHRPPPPHSSRKKKKKHKVRAICEVYHQLVVPFLQDRGIPRSC